MRNLLLISVFFFLLNSTSDGQGLLMELNGRMGASYLTENTVDYITENSIYNNLTYTPGISSGCTFQVVSQRPSRFNFLLQLKYDRLSSHFESVEEQESFNWTQRLTQIQLTDHIFAGGLGVDYAVFDNENHSIGMSASLNLGLHFQNEGWTRRIEKNSLENKDRRTYYYESNLISLETTSINYYFYVTYNGGLYYKYKLNNYSLIGRLNYSYFKDVKTNLPIEMNYHIFSLGLGVQYDFGNNDDSIQD